MGEQEKREKRIKKEKRADTIQCLITAVRFSLASQKSPFRNRKFEPAISGFGGRCFFFRKATWHYDPSHPDDCIACAASPCLTFTIKVWVLKMMAEVCGVVWCGVVWFGVVVWCGVFYVARLCFWLFIVFAL